MHLMLLHFRNTMWYVIKNKQMHGFTMWYFGSVQKESEESGFGILHIV